MIVVKLIGVSPSGKAQDFDSSIVGSNPATPARKKHLRQQVLFSTKFALRASEIALL